MGEEGRVIRFPRPPHRYVMTLRDICGVKSQNPDVMVWDMCVHEKRGADCWECPEFVIGADGSRELADCYRQANQACWLALAWAERLRKLAEK